MTSLRPLRLPLGALALWLGAALAASAARAEPEPMSPEARARAEAAFLLGRLGDVDTALGASAHPVDREPGAVVDLFWRAAGRRTAGPELEAESLTGRRATWLHERDPRRRGPYPVPATGEAEPYPILSALVLDRLRRESRGVVGLPDESPLATIGDERVRWFVASVVRPAFHGLERSQLSAADRRAEIDAIDRADAVARRNASLAAAVGAAFLLGVGALAWTLRRRSSGPSALAEE